MSVPTPAPSPSPWWAAIRSCGVLLLAGALGFAAAAPMKGCIVWPVPPAPVPVIEPTADNPIVLPADFAGAVGRRDDISAKVFAGAKLTWIVDPDDSDKLQTKPDTGAALIVVPKVTGTFYVGALDRGGKLGAPVWCRVTVGDVPPPIPPPGPGPAPPPVPPSPAPIPLAGLRVLIVYDKGAKLLAGQDAVLFGQPMRDFLNSKVIVGPDGKTKDWRFYDQTENVSLESKTWQDAMARKRASVPWLIVSNGVSGFEGPLPATLADTQALITKFVQ